MLTYFGWIALGLGLIALFIYSIVPDQTITVFSLIGGALICALAYCASDWHHIRKTLTGRSAQHGTNAFILSVIFLGILVFINILFSRHNHRFDLTESGLFTLSPHTEKIVSQLPRSIKMTAFFQTQSPERGQFQNLVDGYLQLTDQIQ